MCSANSLRLPWSDMNVCTAATERSASVSLPSMSDADGVLVEVPIAERARRREHVVGERLHLDVELGRHVRLDLVSGDERVLRRALDEELHRAERDAQELVDDRENEDAPADHDFVAARSRAHESLVGSAPPVTARDHRHEGHQHQHADAHPAADDDQIVRILEPSHDKCLLPGSANALPTHLAYPRATREGSSSSNASTRSSPRSGS